MNLPPIYLLHSADYELYLGGSYLSEHELLITPTDELLNIYDSMDVSTTLFVDVACLWRYRELGLDQFPDEVDRQLQRAVDRGHDVQAHIHPHWSETRFKGGNFFFDAKKYLLGTLDNDPEKCAKLTKEFLKRAKDSLTNLLCEVDPDYRCLAFRAGGYGLQPLEGMIFDMLAEVGYKIDSSIIPGAHFKSTMQQVDFRGVPKRANYWLDGENGLAASARDGAGVFEIPIASFSPSGWRKGYINTPDAIGRGWQILLGKDKKMLARGRPCTVPEATIEASRLKLAYWAMDARLRTNFHRLELGRDHRLMLHCVKNYLQPFVHSSKPIFFSLNCHPKGLEKSYLKALSRFHNSLGSIYGDRIKTITFQEAWKIIKSTTW
ncbi:MAG: hypothetical protein HQL70_04345 [Magnetococcales bacterium]|nr:hypothetical protein [Magnetococcales bacterium]